MKVLKSQLDAVQPQAFRIIQAFMTLQRCQAKILNFQDFKLDQDLLVQTCVMHNWIQEKP